jgi:Arc/MetJ family transcription regulator
MSAPMRTNIEIDDSLLRAAMEATGQRTKRAVVEEALRTLVRLRKDVAWIRSFARIADPERSRSRQTSTCTNVEIDEGLMKRALQAAAVATRRAAVDEALRLVVRLHRQKQAIKNLQGIGWEGDLNEMRSDWTGAS